MRFVQRRQRMHFGKLTICVLLCVVFSFWISGLRLRHIFDWTSANGTPQSALQVYTSLTKPSGNNTASAKGTAIDRRAADSRLSDLTPTPNPSTVGIAQQNSSLKSPITYWSRNIGQAIHAAGSTLTERIKNFNRELGEVRRRIWEQRGNGSWKDEVRSGPIRVVWGAEDDYMEQLAIHTNVSTVYLPWLGNRSTWSQPDKTNLLVREYYAWTTDDRLCSAIETPGKTRLRYDAIFDRTCRRGVDSSAAQVALKPVYLNGKPVDKGRQYWPNDGNRYPGHFYSEPPPFVLYLHVHRDAVVTANGFVFSKNVKLVLYSCVPDNDAALPNGGNLEALPLYDEVFVIAQLWGANIYHRLIDIVPRLVAYVDFLNANPGIKILAQETSGSRLGELMNIIGLNDSRLVTGTVRARIVYQPRAVACGFPNVQETQILAAKYHDYIAGNLPPQARDRLVLISRASSPNRQFTEYAAVEQAARKVAEDFNLTFTVFQDNPVPTLKETMALFNSAVLVVGSHGAGLSNVVFSQPGTFVIEGTCSPFLVNMCFAYLSHVTGLRWHGVPSRGEGEDFVDVASKDIEEDMRGQLSLWRLQKLQKLTT